MPDRVFRARDKENIYKDLVEKENSPFHTYKDVFLAAACIGFNNSIREPLSQKGSEILWSYFSKDESSVAMVYSLALAATNDLNILLDCEEMSKLRFQIFEEYANGGINILKELILDPPGDPLDHYINYIFEVGIDNTCYERGLLERIADDLDF
ncbi:MAG: DNA phosphorothioation-associated protein 4 [Bacillota bacterium]